MPAVTTDPTALTGVESDTVYQMQNIGSVVVQFKTAASAPNRGDEAYRVAPSEYARFSVESSESLWVWTLQSEGIVYFQESL